MKKFTIILAAAAMLLVGCKDDSPSITIPQDALTFDGSASSQTIAIKSTGAWTASGSYDWVTISPKSGSGDDVITVTVSKNEGLDRKADFTFTLGSLTSTLSVSQSGYPTLSVSESSASFGIEASTLVVTLKSNYDWTASSDADWVTITPSSGSASASDQSVTLSVSKDESFDRAATITFSCNNGAATAAIAVSQAGSMVEYGGVGYHTVEMKDGRIWLVEPLQYVPAGKTPSSDPADRNGIWYPFTTAGAADTDASSIASRGYLYDYATAFGAEITADNYTTFEGTQGICPDGYHIPSRAELVALCGYSNKAADESAVLVDKEAAYYNSDYNRAKVTDLDADGFAWPFAGMINLTTPTGTGKFAATLTSSANCSVDSYLGKLAMTYLIGSTGYAVNSTSGNVQFFGMMSTFTKTYPEGRATVSYTNYLSGYSVRCIKNK